MFVLLKKKKLLRGSVPPPFCKSETDDFSGSRGERESQRFGIVREGEGEKGSARKGKGKIK